MIFGGFGGFFHLVDLTADCPVVQAFKAHSAILTSGGKINIL